MQCPSCQHDNREQARFCEERGFVLERSCVACGNRLRAAAKFCDACGSRDSPDSGAETVAVEHDDVTGEGLSYLYRSSVAWAAGDAVEAERHARRLLEMSERGSTPGFRGQGLHHLGQGLGLRGRLEEATAALEQAIDVRRARLDRPYPEWEIVELANLARCRAEQGSIEAARESLDEADSLVRRNTDLVRPALELSLAAARVLLRAGDSAERRNISGRLDRVEERARETGLRIFEPRVCDERAELARLVGDEAARERELREAHRLYAEMGATGHAERVARELAS